jgi:hypothetical protein
MMYLQTTMSVPVCSCTHEALIKAWKIQNQTNQNLLENGIIFPNPDRIHPFDMIDCKGSSILY